MFKVTLPPLVEGVNKATATYIYVAKGDAVRKEDKLVEFVTDKATFNLPSPTSGRVVEILIKEGDEVSCGQTVLTLE